MNTIDARGLSCPQPLLLAKQAMEKGDEPVAVLADSAVAAENISRLAAKLGWTICASSSGDDTRLELIKK